MTRIARRAAAVVAAAFVLAVLAAWGPTPGPTPVPASAAEWHVGLVATAEQGVLAAGRDQFVAPFGQQRLAHAPALLVGICAVGASLLGLVAAPPGRRAALPVAHRFLRWLRAPPGV